MTTGRFLSTETQQKHRLRNRAGKVGDNATGQRKRKENVENHSYFSFAVPSCG
jgi:hypothetical protein